MTQRNAFQLAPRGIVLVALLSGCGAAIDADSEADGEDRTSSTSEALMTWSSHGGWDFALPSTVARAPSAGLLGGTRPEIPHRLVTLSWRTLNPSKAGYDFSSVTTAIDDAKAGGYGVVFRLKASTVEISGSGYSDWAKIAFPGYVPAWVASASGAHFVDMETTDATKSNRYICPNQVQTAYHDFIVAFGKALAKYIADPAFLGLYIHGMSRSLGEEMDLPSAQETAIQSACGLDATTLETTFENRIGWWAQAFEANAPGSARKLAWVGTPGSASSATYKTAVANLLEFARNDAKVGGRGGFIEAQWNEVQPARCDALTSYGYLINDLSTCPYTNRYFGDEAEMLVDGFDGTAYAWRNIVLRALARGERFLWTADDVVALDPAVSEYFNRTAGRAASSAPDAWAALRSYTYNDGTACREVKNIERWLHQRDPDGTGRRTNATAKGIDLARDCDLPTTPDDEHLVDWDGRAISSGASLKLFVDGSFLPSSSVTNPLVDVTYRDNGTQFRISYCKDSNGSVGLATTSAFAAGTSGAARTAAIRLDRFRPAKCIGGGYDLAIVNAAGTTAVSFVRIVR